MALNHAVSRISRDALVDQREKHRLPHVLGTRTSLDDALVEMQQARVHVAVVTDPAGRTLGIATLEDVIEELVGEIRDAAHADAAAEAAPGGGAG